MAALRAKREGKQRREQDIQMRKDEERQKREENQVNIYYKTFCIYVYIYMLIVYLSIFFSV